MGRSPCCDEVGLKKGPWTPEEDKMLVDYIKSHGHGSWRNLPKSAGLNRCGKSCRLRWTNYLRPDIKRGKFSEEEERLIIHLHSVLGNKWSAMATRLPGRTDNEIKNYWNTHLKKKLLLMGIDPVTHRPRTDIDILANLCNLANPWDNALRLQADAVHSARVQILQGLVQVLASGSPNMDAVNLFGSTSSIGNYQFNDLIQLNHQLEGLINGTLRLNSGLPNLGIQQLPNKFQAYPESNLGQQGHEMVAQINGSCLNDLATECQSGVANQMLSSYTSPAANSAPSLVSASPENLTTDRMQEPINSKDVSPNSSASTPFDAWEGLNLGGPDTDLCWKHILDQISWSSTS